MRETTSMNVHAKEPGAVTKTVVPLSAWAIVLGWVFFVVAPCRAWFASIGLKYPPNLDTYVFFPADAILNYAFLSGTLLFVLVIANVSLMKLLRSEGPGKVLQEIWFGVLVALPLLGMFGSGSVLCAGVLRAYEAVDRSAFSLSEGPELSECYRLEGEWTLSNIVRAQTSQEVEDEASRRLSFTVVPNRDGREHTPHIRFVNGTQAINGLVRVDLNSPNRLCILRKDIGNAGRLQYAIYRLDGDKLEIIFSDPGTPDAELPGSLDSADKDDELLVFTRKPLK